MSARAAKRRRTTTARPASTAAHGDAIDGAGQAWRERPSSPPRTWALVPIKSFAHAKSRLASALDAGERAALARSLAERVITAARASGRFADVAVLTDGDDVDEWARGRRILVLRDPAPRLDGARRDGRLGGAIDSALAALRDRGATAAAVILADLPAIEAPDLRALVDALGDADVVVAPDRREDGTNALALRLPAPFPTCFGRADSFAAHVGAACARMLARTRAARAPIAILRRPGLARDLDEPDQLAGFSFSIALRRRNRGSRVNCT